jgi:cobalamin biosynthesis Mg chelatase CobN
VWSAAPALASGCNTSAGDSQYVDPLANCNPPSTSHNGGSGGSTSGQTSTTPATVPTPTSTTPTATVASTTTTTTTSASKDPSSSKSLPFTGLNLVPALIVAAGLLGSGLVLRRLTA